jgi:hypothetical protein
MPSSPFRRPRAPKPETPLGPGRAAREARDGKRGGRAPAPVARILEIKRTLDGREQQFMCDVYSRTETKLVALYRLPGDRDVHGVWLPKGTLTVGTFWRDRPYNLYHWVLPKKGTLAYYFNVGDVSRWGQDEFEWDDLAVDVIATPGGRVTVLDEDELPADLDEEKRAYIERARDEILNTLPKLMAEAEQTAKKVLGSGR